MAVCEATANTVVWCLCEVLNQCGPPILTDSDEGNCLTDAPVQKFLDGVGVHQLTHISYRPQSSRVVERANRSIKVRRKLIAEERGLSWSASVCVLGHGNKELARYRCRPYELVCGPAPQTDILCGDVSKQLCASDTDLILEQGSVSREHGPVLLSDVAQLRSSMPI